MDLHLKLDKILEIVTEVRITQAEQALVIERNTDDLAAHMKRTEILEERQGHFEKKMEDIAFPARALKYIVGGIFIIATGVLAVYGVLQIIVG